MVLLTILLAGATAVGCNGTATDSEEAFPSIPPAATSNSNTTEADSTADATPPQPVPSADARQPSPQESADLTLKLKTGDRFPLMKTVRQHITQFLPGGQASGWSELELLMAITVAEQVEDRRRFEVRYQRIRYAHEIGGERVEYDSTHPPEVIPPAAQVYHGMVDNGFSFWLGPDHRVLSVEGFDEFLRRCVAHVPERERHAVLTAFERITSEETIANFVDDSVGLLPAPEDAGRPLTIGAQWSPPGRQIVRPVPMYIRTNCRLVDISPRFAQVVISGTISPGTTYGPSTQPAAGLQLFIQGGELTGKCTIDLQTGLPIHSQIDRLLEMWVQLDDGTRIRQQKTTSTIIRSFPAQSGSTPMTVRSGHTPSTSNNTPQAFPPVANRQSPAEPPTGHDSHPARRDAPSHQPGQIAGSHTPEAAVTPGARDSANAPRPIDRPPRLVPPQTLQ
ncbi:MAG: hypothetical protein D6725_15130 [Planctomycetota bacterium]|nr:MAG: hypothetical protein D6725_15130 [Planctomycetota bacterium]